MSRVEKSSAEDMAFVIEQRFDDVQHEYDRQADVLYMSFGPPRPSVAITVEDCLAIRIAPDAPQLCGLTIIGFKRIFSASFESRSTACPRQ